MNEIPLPLRGDGCAGSHDLARPCNRKDAEETKWFFRNLMVFRETEKTKWFFKKPK